jgi:hypothetical protein
MSSNGVHKLSKCILSNSAYLSFLDIYLFKVHLDCNRFNHTFFPHISLDTYLFPFVVSLLKVKGCLTFLMPQLIYLLYINPLQIAPLMVTWLNACMKHVVCHSACSHALRLDFHEVHMCIRVLTISYKNVNLTKSVIYLVFLCTYYTVHLNNEGLPLSN